MLVAAGERPGQGVDRELDDRPPDGRLVLPHEVDQALGVIDMLGGAADELLEIDLVVAESRLGLAPGRGHLLQQRFGGLHHAHAAPTATPAGLQHHRVAHFLRGGEAFGIDATERRRGRHDWNARRHGEIARRHLVAERAHRGGGGADEGDAGGGAGGTGSTNGCLGDTGAVFAGGFV